VAKFDKKLVTDKYIGTTAQHESWLSSEGIDPVFLNLQCQMIENNVIAPMGKDPLFSTR
jgi:hypothetical protein